VSPSLANLHALGLIHAGKEQRKNIKMMWEYRVSPHSKLMVFGLFISGKHRLTGPTVAVCMIVMAQANTEHGHEQCKLKNDMGARNKKKKLASINTEIIKNLENPSINGGGQRSKWIEYEV